MASFKIINNLSNLYVKSDGSDKKFTTILRNLVNDTRKNGEISDAKYLDMGGNPNNIIEPISQKIDLAEVMLSKKLKCRSCGPKESGSDNNLGIKCTVTKSGTNNMSYLVTTGCAKCNKSKVSFVSKDDLPLDVINKININ